MHIAPKLLARIRLELLARADPWKRGWVDYVYVHSILCETLALYYGDERNNILRRKYEYVYVNLNVKFKVSERDCLIDQITGVAHESLKTYQR